MKSLLVAPPEPRRKLVLDDIWKSLPQNKHMMSLLVETYFQQVHWAWSRESRIVQVNSAERSILVNFAELTLSHHARSTSRPIFPR